jgi:hypothetical protein
MNRSIKSLLAATVIAAAVAGCASVEPYGYDVPSYSYGYDYAPSYGYAPYYGYGPSYGYGPYYGYGSGYYVAPPTVGFGLTYSDRNRNWRDYRGRDERRGSYRAGAAGRASNQATAQNRVSAGAGRVPRSVANAPAQRFGSGQGRNAGARPPNVAGPRTPQEHG